MIQNLLSQFLGASTNQSTTGNFTTGVGESLSKVSSNIPGLAGGAAAGGIMALLVSNKSAQKIAGTAATYGGAALLGGLAYKAYKNRQHNIPQQASNTNDSQQLLEPQEHMFKSVTLSNEFQLTLVKAMIAAAKADGHIDEVEQKRIFSAVKEMDLSAESKGMLFDLLQKHNTIDELAREAVNMEQRTELYLASCLVISPDLPSEQAYLKELASALQLPEDLSNQLRLQAQQAINDET